MICAECQSTFAVADTVLGYPLSQVMEEGSVEELRRTEITQPAVLTLTVAEAYRLMAQGIQPDALAGRSILSKTVPGTSSAPRNVQVAFSSLPSARATPFTVACATVQEPSRAVTLLARPAPSS